MRECLARETPWHRIQWLLLQLVSCVWQSHILRFAVAEVKKQEEAESTGKTAVYMQAEEIMDRYGDTLLRYAYSYLHNMSDAEEILQDTLIQFMKSAPTFTSEQHRKAWLLRVAGNISKNRISYNTIRQTDELKDELVQEEREDLTFVWDAVKQLPVKYREAIHLFYYEGYSTAQIAQILQKNEATVRSLLARGRKQLKKVLKEAYDFAY